MRKKILSIIASLCALCCVTFGGCNSNPTVGTVEESIVKIAETSLDLSVGDSYQLSVLVLPSSEVVEWSSSNPEIVSVDQQGKVTAHTSGTAVITASIGEYEKSFCTIQVEQIKLSVYSFALRNDEVVLFVGEDYKINYTLFYGDKKIDNASIVWSSSNVAVATVTSEGVIQPLAFGETTVTAMYYISNDEVLMEECKVSVYEYIDLRIAEATEVIEVYPGESITLTPLVYDIDGNKVEINRDDLIFSSLNNAIISYENGTFRALACGEAKVKLFYHGSEAFCTIKVKGVSVDSFEVLRGGVGTGVSLSANGMMKYSGLVGESNDNCVVMKGQAWKDMISLAKNLGFTHLKVAIYSVDGICKLLPENTEYSVFKGSNKASLTSEECSLDNPFVGMVSLNECEKWSYMALGMVGNGSFEFAISFV